MALLLLESCKGPWRPRTKFKPASIDLCQGYVELLKPSANIQVGSYLTTVFNNLVSPMRAGPLVHIGNFTIFKNLALLKE